MHPIAASILVLAASICGLAATNRPVGDQTAGLMNLIAVSLGLWGAFSLISVISRDHQGLLRWGESVGLTFAPWTRHPRRGALDWHSSDEDRDPGDPPAVYDPDRYSTTRGDLRRKRRI